MKKKGIPWIQQIICSKFGAICDVVPAHILLLWPIAAKAMVEHDMARASITPYYVALRRWAVQSSLHPLCMHALYQQHYVEHSVQQ